MGFNLRKIRVEQGLSQEALAAEADIDRTYVGRLERQLENPTIGILKKLAEALDVSIVEFLNEPDPRSAPPSPLKVGRKPSKKGVR